MRHGFLLVNKPVGPTSHDVVSMVRKSLGERKIGHLGTLDPLAEGLMVLAVGSKALKVIEFFNELPKQYVAQIKFGAISSTYDAAGQIEAVEVKPGWKELSDVDMKEVINKHFTGKLKQVPPAHSAVHVKGKRAYQLARKGREVKLPSRNIEIKNCKMLKYDWPDLDLEVDCSSGTYIRSLAHDLGQKVRFGAYLSGLKRTKLGDFSLDDACDIKRVAWAKVIPLKDVLAEFKRIDLRPEEFEEIKFGRYIKRDKRPDEDCIGWCDGLPVCVLTKVPRGKLKGRKVF